MTTDLADKLIDAITQAHRDLDAGEPAEPALTLIPSIATLVADLEVPGERLAVHHLLAGLMERVESTIGRT